MGIREFGIPYQHIAVKDVITKLGQEVYNEYFKFAFIRNPWDRICSFYHYLMERRHKYFPASRGGTPIPGAPKKFDNLNDFIESPWEKWNSVKPQYSFFNENTHIGRFETLEQDFSFIMDKIGIQANLKHYNKSVKCRCQDLYNEKSKNIIANLYKTDIDKYNYTFE